MFTSNTFAASGAPSLQPTGSFVHESALSARRRYNSNPPDPLSALASHCIRTAFGERVQRVADGLQAMGASNGNPVTLASLWIFLQRKQESVTTVSGNGFLAQPQLFVTSKDPSKPYHNKKLMQQATVRAALLVLIQHSVVSVQRKPAPTRRTATSAATSEDNLVYFYRYHLDVAARIGGCRYARYVEYMKRALQDPTAATVVETLLLQGSLRTIDVVVQTVQQLQQQQEQQQYQQQQQQQEQQKQPHPPDSDAAALPTTTSMAAPPAQHHKYTVRETTVDAFAKLVRNGYLEQVPIIASTLPDAEEEVEAELPTTSETPKKPVGKKRSNSKAGSEKVAADSPKRIKTEVGVEHANTTVPKEAPVDNNNVNNKEPESLSSTTNEDPAIVNLLRSNAQYKSILPMNAVWRVNQTMFHDSIRALRLGRLVAELFNHRVRWAGSLVTGALKYRAHVEHVNTGVRSSDVAFFKPADMIKYLPKSVVQLMETEAVKQGTSTAEIIHKSFLELVKIRHPTSVVRRVGDESFEITHGALLRYLRERITHQLIEDRHGQVAARIISILQSEGWLESDNLASIAMAPAKDTRSILHELYRSRYIDLFQLSTSQSSKSQYNPGSSIFLWSVNPGRLEKIVVSNVLTAARNLNLRRQHEAEVVGREWIERAQRQAQDDENEHASDKVNYQKFCLGLERIDVCLHQLDETLMALMDF